MTITDAAIEHLLRQDGATNGISPADLKPGQIITGIARWTDSGELHFKPYKKGIKVKTVEPCRGASRRTHTHVNGYGCYDNRIPVRVG